MGIEEFVAAAAKAIGSEFGGFPAGFPSEYARGKERAERYAKAAVRALLPLIAAEMAGVARKRAKQWDSVATVYADQQSIEANTIALAIESHARKMGEGE